MDDLFLAQAPETSLPETVPELYIGTVASVTGEGIELTLDGQTEPMQKKYRQLITGQALQEGARVLAVKISGTYVILGEIGTPDT